MAGTIAEWFKRWFGGSEPVATSRAGEGDDDEERETSTNAQTAGASDEPWPGDR